MADGLSVCALHLVSNGQETYHMIKSHSTAAHGTYEGAMGLELLGKKPDSSFQTYHAIAPII
jgi:hypothetical protein